MKLPKYVTIEFLDTLRNEGEGHPSRQVYLAKARVCNRAYSGKLGIAPDPEFDDMGIDDRQAVGRVNKISQTVNRVESIFMKNEPIVRRWPYRPEDADLSDHMDTMFLQAWDDTHAQNVVASMLRGALITGMSVSKTYWNPLDTTYYKHGGIAVEMLNPESLILDPYASNMHRGMDCRYIIHHTKPPLWWFIDKYGTEGEVALGLRDPRGQGRKRGVMRNLGRLAKDILTGKDREKQETIDVYEYWLFPKTMYASSAIGGDEIEEDEYPYGFIVTMANNMILEDACMPNPFVERKRMEATDTYGLPATKRIEIGHKRHPFSILYWSRKVDQEGAGEYGIYDCAGGVEGMISPQFNANALKRNIAINARTIANPSVIYRRGAIENPPDSLTWLPGQMIEVSENARSLDDALRILEGGKMPPEVMAVMMNDYKDIELAVGLEPGVVSLYPGGTSHTPAMTIGALQESAFGPLWTYVRELGCCLLDLSVLFDGLIQQKYPPDRYMTVGKNGEQYFVDWTNRHITANFRRRVISGASTTLFDVEKDTKMANVAGIAIQAVMSQNATVLQIVIDQIQAMDYPWSYNILQRLSTELERLNQMQQGLQMVGAMELSGGMMPQGQQGGMPQGMLPEQGMPEEAQGRVGNPSRLRNPEQYSGLSELAASLGVPLDQLEGSLQSE